MLWFGEVLGLLGFNGVGKFMMVGMICGLILFDVGSVMLVGGVSLVSDVVGYKCCIGLVL